MMEKDVNSNFYVFDLWKNELYQIATTLCFHEIMTLKYVKTILHVVNVSAVRYQLVLERRKVME